ncbi:hypothetical protein L1987_53298 [Smallanthus sonchifolius]|uniref:Uncharacterized protein n=1 Tax=Smallanthus sonchifolius TaxID=185202 RepID=A0ACB9EVW2_9ASTR|nr:hypothetical protein L1987_53298 [Smallanthus sonchifolius]
MEMLLTPSNSMPIAVKICIDYPNEYLISISGTYGSFESHGNGIVTSMCFKTIQNLYGPFGNNSDNAFSHDVKAGEVIVGFHGRAWFYLNAIGVYVIPNSPSSFPNSTYEGKTKNEDDPLAVEVYDLRSQQWTKSDPMQEFFNQSTSSMWLSVAFRRPSSLRHGEKLRFSDARLIVIGMLDEPEDVDGVKLWEVNCNSS